MRSMAVAAPSLKVWHLVFVALLVHHYLVYTRLRTFLEAGNDRPSLSNIELVSRKGTTKDDTPVSAFLPDKRTNMRAESATTAAPAAPLDRGADAMHPPSAAVDGWRGNTFPLGPVQARYRNITYLDFPATSISVSQASCASLSWERMLEKNVYLKRLAAQFPDDVVEHDYSKVDCDIAVIAAGFQRSGSTLQASLLRLAARLLNARVVEGFWQLHLEQWRPSTRTTITPEERAEARLLHHNVTKWINTPKPWQMHDRSLFDPNNPAPSVVVMKTHQYDDKLRSICRKQILYTVRRDLEPAVASMKKNHFIDTLDDALESLDLNFKNYACWRHYAGAEEWSYESMMRNPLEMVLRTMETLKPLLPGARATNISSNDSIRREVEAAVSGTMAEHFGISNPDNTGRGALLPPGWLEALEARYYAFQPNQ